MNCGFIIRLSGNKISFLYNKADKNGLFPFDGNRPVLPLAILRKDTELVIGDSALKAHQTGSADAFVDILKDAKREGTFSLNGQNHPYGALLPLAVEKYIKDFMQQAYLLQGKTYDELKPELPIGFLFNDCVSDADQEYVMQAFANHGYHNISKIDFSTFLFNNFSTSHVLVVSGDGHDIALRIYDRESKSVMQQRLLPGAGVDPRVKAVAELFYNNLTPAGATREKAMPKLEMEAATVLESGTLLDREGVVNIDGMRFEFFAMRSEIKAASTNVSSQSGNIGVAEFLHEAGIDMDSCSMIVSPTLAANTYFRNELKTSFPEIKFVDESAEKEVLKAIEKAMREGGFDMHKFDDADSDIIDDTPVVKKTNEDGVTILGNKMAKKDIKGEPHATYIIFNITVPKDARYVEIHRRDFNAAKEDEQLIATVAPTYDDVEGENGEQRTIVATEYTDSGLKERTAYKYNFVAVYFDEFGQESHTADLELSYKTVPEVVGNEKPIQLLLTNDNEKNATLKWTTQKRAKLKVYYNMQPFSYKANDPIADESEIPGVELIIDQQYVVKKDFHGEYFYLPVTVRNGKMVAGDPVCVQSKPQPHNVKATYVAEEDVVRVEWDWDDLHNVQVVWQYPGDNRTPVDVQPTSDQGSVDIAKSPKQSQVIVEVRSVFTSAVDGTQVVSVPVKRTVTVPVAGVELTEVKRNGNKYTYTLSTQGSVRVPCDLRLLVKEGSEDFETPDKRIDIKREHWQQGNQSKQFDFTPKDKYADLNFRLVLVDDSYASRINFIAQSFTLQGPERPANVPPTPKKAKPEPVADDGETGTFTEPVTPNNGGGKGSSHTVRNLVVLLLLLVAGYFGYTQFASDKSGGDPELPKQVDYTSATVTNNTLSLYVGDTEMLTVTGEPQGASEPINWESKNTTIASVSSDGTVTAHKKGKAEIEGNTARSGLTLTATVTVKEKDTTPERYTSISASPTSLQLSVGQSSRISLNLTPQKAKESISWETGDRNVASVDQSGNVYAKGVGKTIIIAATEKSNKQVTISVRVSGGTTTPPPTTTQPKSGGGGFHFEKQG